MREKRDAPPPSKLRLFRECLSGKISTDRLVEVVLGETPDSRDSPDVVSEVKAKDETEKSVLVTRRRAHHPDYIRRRPSWAAPYWERRRINHKAADCR